MSQAHSVAAEADVAYVDTEAATPYSPLARFGAELLGTFMLVLAILATAMYGAFTGNAGTLSSALAAGLVLIAGVAAFGNVSGGHFNPAVTLGSAVAGRTRWVDVLPYWVAQIAGAALAGLLLLATIPEASETQAKSGGLPKDWTHQLFQSAANGYNSHSPLGTGTSGALHVSVLSALLIETVATALFVGVILAVTGRRAYRRIAPVAIGFALTALLLFAGPFTGGSLNPARSFAAALYGSGWTWGELWVFLVGPLVGAAIAALFYRAITSTSSAEYDYEYEDDSEYEEEVDPDEEEPEAAKSAETPKAQSVATTEARPAAKVTEDPTSIAGLVEDDEDADDDDTENPEFGSPDSKA